MSLFVLRQFNALGVNGSVTAPSAVGITSRFLDVGDTYPGNILKLEDGKYSSGTTDANYLDVSQFLNLPPDYSSAKRLGVSIVGVGASFSMTVVSPAHATCTTTLAAATAGDSVVACWSGRVTSIRIIFNSLTGTRTARFSWFLFEYPDLTASTSWRAGTQTTGV